MSKETSGQKLKITLGLENYKNVFITRIITGFSQKVCMVFYNSRRPDTLASIRAKITPYVSMVFSGVELQKDRLEKPTMTPLLDIKDWNGDLSRYIIVPVNLAFALMLRDSDFSRLPESVTNIKTFDKNCVFIGKKVLSELTLFDLKDKSTISDLTAQWAKDRNRTTGAGNISIKLVDLIIDEANKSITFQFLSEATELNGKKPNKALGSYSTYSGDKSEVVPTSFKIKKNPSKVYELQIKILQFWDWLNVFEDEEVTSKELKEILKVSDIQVFSTDPSFHFQGGNYNISQLDGSIYPTDIPNPVWGKRMGGDAQGYFLSKHLYSLLRSIDFFIPQMAQKLNTKLKDRNLI